MYRSDSRLLLAVIVPLLIWPWVPAWNVGGRSEGLPGLIVLTVLVPIAEEILFRGFIQGGLMGIAVFRRIVLGISFANWTTSIIFATAHGWQHPLTLLPGYLTVSLVLGYFRERYNGIRVPVLLHAYYNLGLWLFAA